MEQGRDNDKKRSHMELDVEGTIASRRLTFVFANV